MLKFPLRYLTTRISTNKLLWNWSQLFENIIPGYPRGTDIDCCIHYRGHHLYVEAKPLNAQLSRNQREILETLAAKRKNHVLLVGLRGACDDLFNPTWSLACWKWIRDKTSWLPGETVVGGDAEFRVVMLAWKKRIDKLEDGLRARYRKAA